MSCNCTCADSSSSDSFYYVEVSNNQIVLNIFLWYIIPAVLIAAVFMYARWRRLLGFRHRKMLSQFLELLVLAQLLVFTTTLDLFTTVTCDPDLLEQRLGDAWTGNNDCTALTRRERAVVDGCGFQETAAFLSLVVCVWSGVLCFAGVWSYSQEERLVRPAETRRLGAMLAINVVVCSVLAWYLAVNQGECRVSFGALPTAALFICLSYGLIIAEYFIPNSPDIHSAESDPVALSAWAVEAGKAAKPEASGVRD